ncbi:metal ABC transporter permease [Trueperella pecoris]|uniref:Metal ABC transporter permease n=1 Tax=Trueperella pecoris TaxID=2733571 RepID=A0A7M1R005_9ACTO|nr:metal ABC transporter permease [Trueperella pecoris]QOR46767.1 metal ABC transporter permease [Trueperella pecoris]
MSFILSVMLLAVVTSVVCSLPGVFLVLRRQSMLVDALSHAVLPGIVLGALISGSTHSPVMTVIATLCGLLIVIGADRLKRTGLLAGDANQGVIYPALFALGVLLLSTQLSGVHICADTVLVGDLNLMALETEHLIVAGFDIGPRMMWVLIGVGALNVAYIVAAYRVLQAGTFDKSFAAVSGMPVKIVDTVFMVLIALTVVTAFNVAGAILVITLMVVPAATAVLIAGTLPAMIGQTIGISVLSGLVGFLVAWQGDLATTPMMAFVDGVMFCLVLLASRVLPRRLAREAG